MERPAIPLPRSTALAIALLAVLALAPTALGHAGAAETTPTQRPLAELLNPSEEPDATPALLPDAALAAAAPRCIPSCDVQGNRRAMVTPVTVVQDGSTVTWSPTPVDAEPHTATSAGFALDELYDSYTPGAASFELRDDGLYVRSETTANADWEKATDATVLPDGSALLPYICNLHQTFQRGALLVTPNAT